MEENLIIYRVEDSYHTGMYSAETSSNMFELQSRHPPPEDDVTLGPKWKALSKDERDPYHFGFASMEQLKFWIYMQEWRTELESEGYRVSVYSVSPSCALVGETQCVFLPEAAKKLYSQSLLEI